MSILENGTFEAFRGPGQGTGNDPVQVAGNLLLPDSTDTKNPIKIPFDANVIGCEWVFKTKVSPDDTIASRPAWSSIDINRSRVCIIPRSMHPYRKCQPFECYDLVSQRLLGLLIIWICLLLF